jgi:hypothetical protein
MMATSSPLYAKDTRLKYVSYTSATELVANGPTSKLPMEMTLCKMPCLAVLASSAEANAKVNAKSALSCFHSWGAG